MTSDVSLHKKQLKVLCQEHFVEKLYLFGSALNLSHDQINDYDFLVQFNNQLALLDYASNYFSFLEKLQCLFQKPVDLVSEKSLKNEVLIAEINSTKVPLYESKRA